MSAARAGHPASLTGSTTVVGSDLPYSSAGGASTMPGVIRAHVSTIAVRGPTSSEPGSLEEVVNGPVNTPGSSTTPMLGAVPLTDTTFGATAITVKPSFGRRHRIVTDNVSGPGMVVEIGTSAVGRLGLSGPAVSPGATPTRTGSVVGCPC